MVFIVNILSVYLAISTTFILFTSAQSVVDTDYDALHYSSTNVTGSFSFNDCGESDSVFRIQHLSILPDPVILGRRSITFLRVNTSYEITEHFRSKTKFEVDLRLRLKIPGGHKEVCEIIGEPACHFNDLLGELETHGIHVDVNKYLSKGEHEHLIFIPLEPIPFILKGTFDVTVYIKQQGRKLGCLYLHFCITECLFQS
ncbi:hypothetical protein ACF0H5_001802 [Mactra antiquata]